MVLRTGILPGHRAGHLSSSEEISAMITRAGAATRLVQRVHVRAARRPKRPQADSTEPEPVGQPRARYSG